MSSHTVYYDGTAKACSGLNAARLTATDIAVAVEKANLPFTVFVDAGSSRGSTRNTLRFVRRDDGHKSKPITLTKVKKAIASRLPRGLVVASEV